ncbi:MAG: methyltransferase domain-containing protein [Candidatus Lokiarchaeota archaeon]|nr:methyltransferase domain-containing protein [Candidatus Lokiarchaeota archaeon]
MSNNYDFNVKRKRPEEIYSDVSDYFKGEILEQYASSKSIMKTQEEITIRALELLNLERDDLLILDAGSGPGFTAMYLNEIGYKTVAIDLISEFLNYYDIKELNPIVADMCLPPFKPSTFDAIISISALQWIYRDIENQQMSLMLKSLSKSFFQILKPNSRVVIQFYPKSKKILENIGKIITESTGFHGNFIIDHPNSQRKRKIYLLLEKET